MAGLRERGYPVEYIDHNLSETEVARLYAACDCLVHPFRGEGFALPVVEAMACGLPVIVTGAGRLSIMPPKRRPTSSPPAAASSPNAGWARSRRSAGPGCSSRTWMRWSSC